MTSYRITCPACQQAFTLQEAQLPAYVGRQVPCSQCGAVFLVMSDAGGVRAVPVPVAMPAASGAVAGPAPTESNGLAVAGLVCGILGFFTCGLASIAGLICSIMGLQKANQRQGAGKGMAIAGLCCSGVALLFIPLMISILLPSLARARETANRVKCASHLRQIGLAEIMYANSNRQRFSPDLAALVRTQMLSKDVLLCPSADASLEKSVGGMPCVYIYTGQGLTESSRPDAVVAYEPLEAHNGEGMNVLYADGHVSFMLKGAAQQIIRSLEAGQNPPQ